jgi:superkiller protein 8
VFIHKTGVHHVDAFQDTIDGERVAIVATVSYSGEIFFLSVNGSGEITKLELSLGVHGDSFWAVKWLKDHLGQRNRFAASQPTGTTKIWDFTIEQGVPQFTLHGEIKSQNRSFATCLDLNSEQNLLATGFQNGDVVLTQIETAKPVYTFRNFGLKGSSQSSSTVRSVRFSPLGKILAIASDSGSYGTVTLYDTTYGENVGSLTIPTHSTSISVGAYAHEGWVFEVDFNEAGDSLVTAGYDGKVRIWNIETREREATLNLSPTDVDDEDIVDEEDGVSSAIGVKFIPKGVRGGAGGDTNDGLVVISLDRGVRWYREAGGI